MSKAKQFILTIFVAIISIALSMAVLTMVTGCGGSRKIDIWNGTYENEGDFLVDKGIAKFKADLQQTDPETGYVETAKVELQGYSSETSEVVSLFLDFIAKQFIIVPKQPAEVLP